MPRHRKEIDDQYDDETERPSRRREKQRGGKFWRRFLLLTLLLAALIGFLPTIVASTSLRNTLANWAIPDGAARVNIGSASLGWMGGQTLNKVELRDAAGNSLATIESVQIGRSLLNLAANQQDLGTIEVQKPTIFVELRPDGSNWDALISKFVPESGGQGTGKAAPQAAGLNVALKIQNGRIAAIEKVSGQTWLVDPLNVELAMANSDISRLQMVVEGELQSKAKANDPWGNAQPAGASAASPFAVRMQPVEGNNQRLEFKLSGFPLELAAPFVRATWSGTELAGLVTADGNAQWPASASLTTFPPRLETQGRVEVRNFAGTIPALQGDRIRLDRIELPWKISLDEKTLTVKQMEVRSEVIALIARGQLDRRALDRPSLDAAAWITGVDVGATLDLARLGAMLPRTMRLREGTQIDSGTVELTARTKPSQGGLSFTGQLKTSPLVARNRGREIRWDQPVDVACAAQYGLAGWSIDSLRCDSEFLTINAAGNADSIQGDSRFDLDRLSGQLRQFVDLDPWQMAGTGTADFDWRRTDARRFTATANSLLQGVRVASGNQIVWEEQQTRVEARAAGRLVENTLQPTRVDKAELRMLAQEDSLNVRLVEAIDLDKESSAWQLAVSGKGSLARWLTRARPWLGETNWSADGTLDLTAQLLYSPMLVEVTDASVKVSQFAGQWQEWLLREPRLEASGDFRWDGATVTVKIGDAQLVSSTAAVRAKDVALTMVEGDLPRFAGLAAVRVDLARLSDAQATSSQKPPWRASGMVIGDLRFEDQSGAPVADVQLRGENVALAQWVAAQGGQKAGYRQVWQEPLVTATGRTTYDAKSDRLAVQKLVVESKTLQASADGAIENFQSSRDVRVNGTMKYDLAKVTPLLVPYVGTGLTLVGREEARFQLAGALPQATVVRPLPSPIPVSRQAATPPTHWSRQLTARAELPWTQANLYGLPIGPGRVVATLDQGQIRFEPLRFAVGEGQLDAQPNVRLDPPPSELMLKPGQVITNVRISPEVSHTLLKYIAPVLADATQSDGQFSVHLSKTRVPLDAPRQASIEGELAVHAVRVLPGPSTREWVQLAQQIEALAKNRDPQALLNRPPATLLSMADQKINFQVVNGRVYHQGMTFQVGEAIVRSQGSVGFDETLALTLEVPIQDKWVANDKFLAGLRGQSVRIPVAGSLSRPEVDHRAVARLSDDLIRSAAQQAVGSEVNKALEKLFKSR